GEPLVWVISIDSIVQGAHLLPVYGHDCIPKYITPSTVLDHCRSFLVNHPVNHHAYGPITSIVHS
ncbi:hypothetical protein P691DRAFT_680806, partial [Macrolepiota fuliginosa MF-IS2]